MEPDDVAMRVDYFHNSSDAHLHLIGVDRERLPGRDDWLAAARSDAARPVAKRDSYGVVWELDGEPVGFSTTDRIVAGHDAYMHLHVTNPHLRRRGIGTAFVQLSVRHYFDVFELQRLYCEPNSLNVAPNRTLQRAGFSYEFSHEATPTSINYPQVTTRWVIHRSTLSADRLHPPGITQTGGRV